MYWKKNILQIKSTLALKCTRKCMSQLFLSKNRKRRNCYILIQNNPHRKFIQEHLKISKIKDLISSQQQKTWHVRIVKNRFESILFFLMRKKCKKKKEILNHGGERSRKKEERNKNREKGAPAQRRLIELKNNRGHLENRWRQKEAK